MSEMLKSNIKSSNVNGWIQLKDENGNGMVDENGTPLYDKRYSTTLTLEPGTSVYTTGNVYSKKSILNEDTGKSTTITWAEIKLNKDST